MNEQDALSRRPTPAQLAGGLAVAAALVFIAAVLTTPLGPRD